MPSPLTTIPSTGLEANLVNTITQGVGPKITSITYVGDDTAALPAGGQTITVNGSGFKNTSTIYIDGAVVGVVSYVDANTLTFVAPAKAASNYSLYVVNADGATAISVPGISYSNAPVWSTSSGSVGSPYEANTFNVSLSATGDGSVTYAMAAGNSLPSGLTLASNGYISGTVPATDPTTTYTFYVDAIDSQNQETTRSFSITYNKDEVTWASPANGAAYSAFIGDTVNTALSATSSSGRSITYTVQSGSLPANVSISGASIVGVANAGHENTAVVIRASETVSGRYTDRTLYYFIDPVLPDPYYANVSLLLNFNGSNNGTTFTDSSSSNLVITSASGSVVTSTVEKKFGTAAGYFTGPYNYLTVASSSGFTFGTGNFTIEAWVYKTANEDFPQGIIMWRPNSWYFAFNNNYGVMAQVHVAEGYGLTAHGKPAGFTFELNRWYHAAIVRNGNSLKSYIDGQEAGSTSMNTYGSNTNVVDTGTLAIGSYGSGASQYGFQGYIDGIRITKGVARYTSNFTPPTTEFANR